MATKDGRTVHVVMGVCGEYSDRREWPVIAYEDKAAAEKHADDAMKWMHDFAERERALEEADDDYYYGKSDERLARLKANPFDDRADTSYTGTDYFVYAVPLAAREGK